MSITKNNKDAAQYNRSTRSFPAEIITWLNTNLGKISNRAKEGMIADDGDDFIVSIYPTGRFMVSASPITVRFSN